MKSSVAIVLSAHMPYLRAAGRSHAGEEPIHELLAYTLIPTLNSLYDLRDLRLPVRIGLAYSPILLEQLADPVVLKHFGFWLDERRTQLDAALDAAEQAGETERVYSARFFREWCEGIRHSFDERFGLNPIAALRQLCEDGVVEPLASAASSPRLASIGQTATLHAQIELGALAVTRTLGTHPHGFWSPALEYRRDADTPVGESGMQYVIANGPQPPEPAWLVPHRLAAIARDNRFDPYLVDPDLSYAGDPLYLDPTAKMDGRSWARDPIDQRRPYDPYDAYRRVLEHADHFAEVMATQLTNSETPICVLALDAKTMSVDWFEGSAWLRALLERLANHPQLELTTPAAWLRTAHLKRRQSKIPIGESTQPNGMSSLQRTIHAAELRLAALAQRQPDANDEHERVLNQAARELLLAQSNDLASGSSYEAPRRAMRHLVRCVQLCDLAERGNFDDADLTLLETFEQEDNSFAFLNYRMFA